MHTSQLHLANDIVATLRGSGSFDQVSLVGSISLGSSDSLSDIDVVLMSGERPPWENVQLASAILGDSHGCLLSDWAGSLIPGKYLISHFLPGVDIMWWVDIGCYPDSLYRNISRDDIDEDWNAHIARLIVMNAKHYFRGSSDKLRVSELYAKVMGRSSSELDEAKMFEGIRAAIDDRLLAKEFVHKMDAVLQRVFSKST